MHSNVLFLNYIQDLNNHQKNIKILAKIMLAQFAVSITHLPFNYIVPLITNEIWSIALQTNFVEQKHL